MNNKWISAPDLKEKAIAYADNEWKKCQRAGTGNYIDFIFEYIQSLYEEDNVSKEPIGSVDEILLNKAKQLGISVDFSDKEYDGDKEAPMDRIGFLDYLINESHKSSEQCVEIAKQFTNSKLEEIETKIKSHIKWCEENIKLLTIRDAPIATEINTHPYRQFIRLLKKLK